MMSTGIVGRGGLRRAAAGVWVAAGVAGLGGWTAAGELDDYVRAKDPAFGYQIAGRVDTLGVRMLKVRVVSQNWRGKPWRHWLVVCIPPQVGGHQKGVLLVEGGSNSEKEPDLNREEATIAGLTATMLKAPIALLLQVPNQPMFGKLKEDDLIAHTFDRYLAGGEADWPLLLPMVKSATAAMDVLQAMAGAGELTTLGGQAVAVGKFAVAGASKRGWTTWLTAAVDPRVCALAPSVIDVLNMPEQMKRQQQSYGQFSANLRPYIERDILNRFNTPRGADLCRIVDPYAYLERFKQPKLMLLGSNDAYWTVDSAQLYFPQLPGPKALYYLPNAGHKLGLAVLPTLNNFLLSVLEEKPFPELRSEIAGGELRASWAGEGQPTLWRARSASRDFRKAQWESEALPAGSSARVKLEEPASGWLACYLSVMFPGVAEGAPPFSLSTPMQVVPERFPYP